MAEASDGPDAVKKGVALPARHRDHECPDAGGRGRGGVPGDPGPDPNIKILMLTSFSDDEALFNSIMVGASGYLLKGVQSGELVKSIRSLGEGKALSGPRGHPLGAPAPSLPTHRVTKPTIDRAAVPGLAETLVEAARLSTDRKSACLFMALEWEE